MRMALRCFLCSVLVFLNGFARAQNEPADNLTIFSTNANISSHIPDSNVLFVIRDIDISGNNKTKKNIILREVSFHLNEEYRLNVIIEKLFETKRQLMNTGLFREVTVTLKSLRGYDVFVNIELYEKWNIFPVPFIRTVDRNFQEWYNKGASAQRLNYGINLNYNNFTGHNDKLSVNLLNGYTKQVYVQYNGIFLDKQLKWSTNLGFSFGGNREVNYMTYHNKQMFFKDNDEFLRSYYHFFAEVGYRPAIKTKHSFGISYNYENIADTIFKLNPYFSERKNGIRYVDIFYRLSYFDVDFIPYPTSGVAAEFTLRKKGFNDPVNLWQLTAKASRYFPVGLKSYINLRAIGMVKAPFAQPYITRQFLGYDGQFLQGYEDYTIDGVAGAYGKASFARQLLNFRTGIPSQRIRRLNDIPVKLYAKVYVNAGYAYNPYPGKNMLPNRLLYSGGVGIDIVTFNDFVIKLEWSFNQLSENGLYLHRRDYF